MKHETLQAEHELTVDHQAVITSLNDLREAYNVNKNHNIQDVYEM